MTDIGKTYMLIDAWRDGEPAKISGNEVDVKFAAIACKEV
ncbi:MAG: phage tail tube protein [Aeromonadaceae bacterium]